MEPEGTDRNRLDTGQSAAGVIDRPGMATRQEGHISGTLFVLPSQCSYERAREALDSCG